MFITSLDIRSKISLGIHFRKSFRWIVSEVYSNISLEILQALGKVFNYFYRIMNTDFSKFFAKYTLSLTPF